MLQVWLLGQFEIKLEGRRVVLSARAAQSLFAYLILSAGTLHRREKLAGLFWSDLPEENARRNLRHELWRTRKALVSPTAPNAEYILADELTLTFNRDASHWLDAAQLQKADSDAESLISSLSLYRGELLPGMYDDWVSLERERLQAVYENKMQMLLEKLIEQQRWNTAIEWSERWISQGQTPEPAYRALMAAHAAMGNRAQVATIFERCKTDLEREVAVEPSEETKRLHAQMMAGQPVESVNLTPIYYTRVRLPFHEEPPATGEPPFKGLDFFDEQDAALFFGREQLTAKLAQEIRANQFLAVVVGASGSGKSSLVRAGLVPKIKTVDDGQQTTHAWRVFVMTPTAHPLEALAMTLTRDSESVTATATLMDDLARDPRSFYLFLRRMTNDERQTETHSSFLIPHTLLVVDQFEELFTLCHEELEREQFIDNLLTALGQSSVGSNQVSVISDQSPSPNPQSPLTIVLTLRADFYAHLAQYPELRDAVAKHQEFIGPMTSEELRRAIQEPARKEGWEFEPGLVDLILRDVGDEPGALPLLSHALLETWKRRSGHVLTLKGYHDAGGVRGAIAQTAENVYQQFSPQEQMIVRDIFLRLTELGEGTEDTRRRASFDELIPQNESAASVHAILTRLADARLITLSQDSAQVAHEALIREWPQLREWLNQDREGLRVHRQITEAANEWDALEHDTGALYRGARLIQAREYAEKNPYALNAYEREFLQASDENEIKELREKEEQRQHELEQAQKLAETESKRAEEQQRGARRLRWFAAGLALFLLVALSAAVFAFNQSAVAQNNFTAAERIRIASQAQIVLDNGEGGDLPAMLSLQSLRFGYSPEADASLLNALKRGFTKRIFGGDTNFLWGGYFSPDGRKIVTAGDDARVYDVETGKELARYAPPQQGFAQASFMPDSRHVILGTANKMQLWDTEANQIIREYPGLAGGAWGFDISSDGKYVVTADDEGAKLFDAQTGKLIRAYSLPNSTPAIFSPDDKYIAISSADNIARVWEVATGKELHQFPSDAFVPWISFSPDGKFLLTMAGDNAQLWDVQTGEKKQRFLGHVGLVLFGGFSPDGKYVVTGGADKTARIWDIATGNEVRRFTGHTGRILWAEYSPDAHYLLTAGEDGTARLWDIQAETEPHRILTYNKEVWGAGSVPNALSSDGHALLYNFDRALGAVVMWNPDTGAQHFLNLEGLTIFTHGPVFAFSPDNRFLLGGDTDEVGWLWDAQTGKQIHKLMGHTGPIKSVAYSPDGRLLLSGSEDKSARLWDAQSGKELLQFLGHTAAVRAVAFSPDGKFVLTGSDDKTARMWDTQTGKELKRFVGHTAPVRAVAFSPDGKFIVTGGDDQTARVWEVAGGQELKQLIGHSASISQVAFSPDGQFVLIGSADQTARLWNARTGQVVREFPGHASPLLFAAFADHGRTVITGDIQAIYHWRASLEDVIAFTCSQLTRDLTDDERALYGIKDSAPTCAR